MALKRYKHTSSGLWSAVCGLLFSLLLSGCVSTDEVGRMRWEINTLKSDVREIKETSRNIETQLPGQTKEIDAKISELEDAQKAAARTVSDLLMNVQSLTSEFQVLTGRFEEARYFSEKSSTEVLESKELIEAKLQEHELALKDLEQKLTQLTAGLTAEKEEQKRKIEDEKKAEDARKKKEQEEDKSGAKDAASGEVKDVYMTGYRAYKAGNTEEARKHFKAVLDDYPTNEYSDNARFWIAESYYAEGGYEDAILGYEELFKNHPESDKVPGAMLKQGLAFYALKDKSTGKIVLERLIEKYPDTEQARLAKKKINKTLPPKKKK